MQAIRRVLAERPRWLKRSELQSVLRLLPRPGGGPPARQHQYSYHAGKDPGSGFTAFPGRSDRVDQDSETKVNDKGEIVSWEDFSRFVMNQDTGGAIKGPGRADLFWGAALMRNWPPATCATKGTLHPDQEAKMMPS